MEQPIVIAALVLASIACLVKWYYDTSEKKYENFIMNRLRKKTRSELENKSERQLRIEEDLASLGNPTTYETLHKYSMLCMIGIPVVCVVIGMPVLAIIPIIVGFRLPEIYITHMKEKKIEMFSERLLDALSKLLAIIQAGQTQTQGFKVLAEDAYPIGTEFGRIYHDINTGATLKQALDDFYERIPLPDVRLFNIGAIIASKATPAVAISTLKTITSTIQKRENQKKSIKSAVIGGQTSAIILSLLPIVVFVAINVMMPEIISEWLATFMGKVLLGVAAILDCVGYYVARRITSSKRMITY